MAARATQIIYVKCSNYQVAWKCNCRQTKYECPAHPLAYWVKQVFTLPPWERQTGEYEVIIPTFSTPCPGGVGGSNDWCINIPLERAGKWTNSQSHTAKYCKAHSFWKLRYYKVWCGKWAGQTSLARYHTKPYKNCNFQMMALHRTFVWLNLKIGALTKLG